MKVRRISDELCKENGLSVIEPKRGQRLRIHLPRRRSAGGIYVYTQEKEKSQVPPYIPLSYDTKISVLTK